MNMVQDPIEHTEDDNYMSEEAFLEALSTFKSRNSKFRQWTSKHQTGAIGCAKREARRRCIYLSVVFGIGLLAYACYEIDVYDILTEESCLIPFPETIQDIFRPLSPDCDFCMIDSVAVRSNLSEEEFYLKYAFTGLPLLVTDGMKDWTTDIFNFEYFKRLYSNYTDILKDSDNDCQFLHWRSTDLKYLADLFEIDEARSTFQPGAAPWYAGWSNCIPEVTEILRQHYTIPYFLGRSERTKQDWIFMGSPGYKGAPLHIDFVDYASWQAQIKGEKLWRMTPPPECWYKCPNHVHKILVKPGNIFVFDSNRWFHATEVLEGEYSLTIGAEYD